MAMLAIRKRTKASIMVFLRYRSCPASPEKRRPSAARLLPAPTQMALCPGLCLLRLLRRELLRAFATLDDSTPQRRISELRVWSYELFIVFAPSSSGYTSGQNLEVLYILNNRNNQNILEIMRFISRN